MHKVLVVDDDLILQESVKKSLQYHDFLVDVACNGQDALNKIYQEKFDLVVMDVNMPEMDGLEALSLMKKYNPSLIVLILTAYSNISDAVRAVKEGAYNYLEKPISTENLVSLIKRALKARTLVETTAFSSPRLSLGKKNDENLFVGESESMVNIFNLINKLSKVNTPVLIQGESGTGKELVARAIHYNGPRKDEKFVAINCAAIPDNLIESELFGHEKGAFTGASERKIGKFQFAEGGTIFLDEIGDISLNMQVKLLRVLQEKTFTPLGSNRDISLDVRVIAATHKNLSKLISEGKFRDDFYYRLNVLPVYLPPLRERVMDIPHLISHYIKHFNKIHNLDINGMTDKAKDIFLNYKWPGNIRELRNVIEHAFIMESTNYILPSSLPEQIVKQNENSKSSSSYENNHRHSIIDDDHMELEENSLDAKKSFTFSFGKRSEGEEEVKLDFQNTKDMFEKEFIMQALKLNKGKINQTALKANIPKKTLLRKIEKYGLDPKSYYEQKEI